MRVYVCYGGWVTSQIDGDTHWIDSATVARLHHLYPKATDVMCVPRGSATKFNPRPNDIHLYPSAEGDYYNARERHETVFEAILRVQP